MMGAITRMFMGSENNVPVSADRFPARLHVIFARRGATAIVFRRGPSKKVCTFEWDRKTDRFTIGQWLKGRIYERRSDLSANGRYLLYFAMNGRWSGETGGSWTAVSRAPYLKALNLHPKGDCWNGGGLFLDDRHYWLNDGGSPHGSALQASSLVKRCDGEAGWGEFGSEDTGVYYPRLIRDGWRMLESKTIGKWHDQTIFEKDLPKGWVLRKYANSQVGSAPGRGCYWDGHELLHAKSETKFAVPWEWSEWDRNRLVWSEEGRLYRSRLPNKANELSPALIHDFNDYSFEPLIAPY